MQESQYPESEKLGLLLAGLLKTAEMKSLSKSLAGEILSSWAGEKTLKKKASTLINRRFGKILDRQDPGSDPSYLSTLFEDPAFFNHFSSMLPSMIKGLADFLTAYLKKLDEQPDEVKVEVVESLLGGLFVKKDDYALNPMIGILKSLQTSQKDVTSKPLLSFMSHWLSVTDFGEIKEMLNSSRKDIEKGVKAGNDIIWQYPAKLVILLSMLPLAINTALDGLKVILSGFNQSPPDLVADIINALIREVDPDSLAGFINQGAELLRKVHTGSALIGDPGSPRLSEEVVNLLQRVSEGVDTTLAFKAKTALEKEKQIISNRLHDNLVADPKRLGQKASFRVQSINSRLNRFNHKLANFDDLSETDFGEVLEKSLSDLDQQELSDSLEQTMRFMLRFIENQPEFLPKFIEQIFQQLELAELQDFVSEISNQMGDGLRPLGRATIPKMVTGICGIIAKAEDEFEGDAAEAREALRSLLMVKEVQA